MDGSQPQEDQRIFMVQEILFIADHSKFHLALESFRKGRSSKLKG